MGERGEFRHEDGELESQEKSHEDDNEHPESASSPERERIRPGLTIIPPTEDFKPDAESIKSALNFIVGSNPLSIEELLKQGYDYSHPKEYPRPHEIRADEIVGTELKSGWAGLVEGFGPEQQIRKQDFSQFQRHVKAILGMKREERDDLVRDISLTQCYIDGKRQVFVDADGRHRILVLKTLSQLGCYVSIHGIKVGELIKNEE